MQNAVKENPPAKGSKQASFGEHKTSKQKSHVKNTRTYLPFTRAPVTLKAVIKPSPKPSNKSNIAVQSEGRLSKKHKAADRAPNSKSRYQLRPRSGPKHSTESYNHAKRDLRRNASHDHGKRQSSKAEKPREIPAIKRRIRKKVSKSIAEKTLAPEENLSDFYSSQTQSESIQENQDALNYHQPLTKEALEELDRQFQSTHQTNRPEDESSQESGINSQEPFNRKWGYVPPLDEESIRIIKTLLKHPARAQTMAAIGPADKEFQIGLRRRNVLLMPSTQSDPYEKQIRSMSIEGSFQESEEQIAFYEELWELDKAKCTPDSSEALYQRTLMMNLIARHLWIYETDSSEEHILDFIVEEPWGCLPMPSRVLWIFSKGVKNDEAKLLTQPKPDLAVCFKREAVISDRIWNMLPEPTRRLACFEDSSANVPRIFHFLAIEAKKAAVDLESPQALYQCLNSASQALHNTYEFFRDAGPDHEAVFFDMVRFFSIVANRDGVLVRIHRAVKISDDAGKMELVLPDQTDYRLQFEFREFQRVSNVEFCRENVLEVMRKIFQYARDKLSKVINAAASELSKNLEKDPEQYFRREVVDFYSHGLPNPRNIKSSKGMSVFPSTIGEGVQQQFRRTTLESNGPLLEKSTVNGQTTPKRSQHLVASSRVSTTSKKRKIDEGGLDDPSEIRSRGSPVRKRGRPRRAKQ